MGLHAYQRACTQGDSPRPPAQQPNDTLQASQTRFHAQTYPSLISPASWSPAAAQGPPSRCTPVKRDRLVGPDRLGRAAASFLRGTLVRVVMCETCSRRASVGRGVGAEGTLDDCHTFAPFAKEGPKVAAVFDPALDGAIFHLVDDALRRVRIGRSMQDLRTFATRMVGQCFQGLGT
jgi:hypothetical protein